MNCPMPHQTTQIAATNPRERLRCLAAVFACCLIALQQTHAATATWNVGSGSWNRTTNWTPTSVPGISVGGDIANFTIGTGAAKVITLDNGSGAAFSPLLTNLNVTTGGTATAGLTINAGSGGSLTIANGGTIQWGTGANTGTTNVIGAGIVMNGTMNLNLSGSSSAPLFINGAMSSNSGTSGVTISGTGAVTYQGANTYTGATTVNSGTLNLNRTGGASLAGNLTVAGGTVNLQQSNQIASTKSISVSSGSLNIGANSNTVAGLQITGGSITGSTGVLTSATAYDVQAGTVSAILGGTVGLNKTTSGNATLSASNTYSGTTTVSAGKLTLNATGNNAISGDVNITGGTLELGRSNQIVDAKTVSVSGGTLSILANSDTIGGLQLTNGGSLTGTTGVLTSTTVVDAQSGNIGAKLGGTSGLNKTTANTVTITSANTFTGTTTVSAGTLNLNTPNAGATTPALAGNVAVPGGILVLQQSNQIATNKTLSVSGGTVNIGASNNTLAGVSLTGGGTITGTTGVLNSTTAYDIQNGTVSAILGGNSGLNKTSSNAATLTAANTFAGTTNVTAGTLNLNNAANSPALAGPLTINGGTVATKANNQLANTKTVTVSSGTLDVGATSQTVGALSVANGLVQGTTGTITSSSAYDIQGGSISAKLAGNVGLNKTGTGTATLSGANTYTGNTAVNAGILNLNSTSGPAIAGNVIVNGGTLALQQNNQIKSTSTVNVSSGNLSVSSHSNTVAGITVTGGTVSGGSGVLTSNTNYDVQAGTISARLGGTVGLNKTGTGSATLSGINTFTGDTNVNGGTLTLGTLGTAIQGNVNVNASGTLVLQQNQQLNTTKSLSISGGTLNPGGQSTTVGALHLTNNGLITGPGTITSGAAFDLQSGTVNAVLTGTSGANVTNGTVTLTGQNAYSGTTAVSSNGTLILNNATAPALAGDLQINSTGTVVLQKNNQTSAIRQLSVSGGSLDTGTFGTSVKVLSLSNSGNILGNGQISASSVFNLDSGTVNAALSGAALVNVGPGIVNLNGANTYTGATLISGGRLNVNGSTAAASDVVIGGGTLGGTGTVGGNVSLNAGTIDLNHGTITGQLQTSGGSFTGTGTVNGVVSTLTGNFDVTASAVLNATTGVTVIGGTLGVAGTINGNVSVNAPGTVAFTAGGKIRDTLTIGNGIANITGPANVGGLRLNDQTTLKLGSTSSLFLNNGKLDVFGDATITGGTLGAGASGFHITNNGTLTLNSNAVSTGGLIKDGNGVLALKGTTSLFGAAQIRQGTLSLDGTLTTPQLILGPGTTFDGSGTLIGALVNNGGTFNPGHSPGTLRISGDFTQTPNGTLVLQVQNGKTYDRVIAGGTVHLAGTLDVQDWNRHKFNYGDIVPNFIQASKIDGHYAQVLMPTPDLRGRLVNDGQNLSLIAAPASYTLVAKTPNQLQVAKALDHWIGRETGDVGLVTLALDVQTAAQYPAALDAISPAYYSVLPQMGVEQATAHNTQLQQRFSEIHTEVQRTTLSFKSKAPTKPKILANATAEPKKQILEKASPAAFAEKDESWTAWEQTAGQFAQFPSLVGIADSHFDTISAVVGVDHRLGSKSAAGIAIGYNYTNLGFAYGDRTTVDSGRISLYGVAGLGDGFFLDGAVTGGYSSYDMKRPIQFSFIDRTALGRTDGSELSAAVQFGKDFHAGHWTITPKAGFQYTRVHINGLNETNAGALNLALNGYGAQSMRGTVGTMVSYEAKLSEKVTLVPYLTASWQHEFDAPAETVRAALPADGGGSFRYDGRTLSNDRMDAGAGFMLNIGDNATLNLGYMAEFGSGDYESHMIMLMMSYRF